MKNTRSVSSQRRKRRVLRSSRTGVEPKDTLQLVGVHMTARGKFTPIEKRKNRDLTDAALQVKVSRGPVGRPNLELRDEDGPSRPKR